jgi:4-aminobutyrate aminotransferase-like enzyme
MAHACVAAAYRGDAKDRALHLAAPLAGKMIRIAPPLVITEEEAKESAEALYDCLKALEKDLSSPAS